METVRRDASVIRSATGHSNKPDTMPQKNIGRGGTDLRRRSH